MTWSHVVCSVMIALGGCATVGPSPSTVQALTVDDFTFQGPLGSDGARIEPVGRNHFRVTLSHAPNHVEWPNKLNFRILRHARGNQLRIDVVFPEGKGMAFNEYHQSFSYDGKSWFAIAWEKGHLASPLSDTLLFPAFSEDQVFVGTQVPLSHDDAVSLIDGWKSSPYVRVQVVGKTLGGRDMHRIEITDPASPHPRARRWVHYLANQHPGEHNSQWRLVGMVKWMLGDEAADFRRRNIVHVILMMSPDAPSHGWYRVNAQGMDMNRSYRVKGADPKQQAHEPYLWQKDLEALMASDAPVTTIWAIHTWGGIVEPRMIPGREIGTQVGPWTEFRDILKKNDRLGLVEELVAVENSDNGDVTWSAGPHAQFGITGVLCEGGAVLQTRRLNEDSGVAIIKSIAQYYKGTRP